jgi:GlcNAc-PI de-N-acetylase
MMRILMVFAHPDDEILFGYPVMSNRNNYAEVSLLTLAHNKEKYGEGPEKALKEVSALNHVHLLDFPRLDTNFYRLPPRYVECTLTNVLNQFYYQIEQAIDLSHPDFIFTHNPMGEYGHGDHRMVFNLVSLFPVSLMLTDICFKNLCHLSSEDIPDIYGKFLFGGRVKEHHTLNMEWYKLMKGIYEKHRAWSWGGHDAVKECNLYQFH